ncbi:MAG: transglycosylase SLT domain-containing protein [Parahaliea sp.]
MRFFLLPALLASLALTACNNETSEQRREREAATGAPAGAEAPPGTLTSTTALPQAIASFNQPWTGDLDGMVERRVLRVLTVYGPGRYYLEADGEKGLVAESIHLFEDFLNKRLDRRHLRLHVLAIPVARDQLLPALLQGRGDLVMASLTITPERQAEVDFSKPTSNAVSEVLVTGPGAPPIASLDDMAGTTINVRMSSAYRESLEAINRDFEARGLAPLVIEPISELLEDDDLIEMVNGGLLPWAIVDRYKTALWTGVFTHITVRDDIVFRSGDRLAWAMRKNSPQLMAAANDFLKTHREGTRLGNVLRNRYIRDFDWAANALNADDYKRFRDLSQYFVEYGKAYELDHLMAAAQGYQESRLDQQKRSPSGAVGVMQLLPSTAADNNVGIPDISTADNNIHAGIKYLTFLRDRYFTDPDIDILNRNLLALAAYNAGPARVRKLREHAATQGYDPNVWFDNVEIMAARDIGHETVQYVANIYKYYLSYRMVEYQQEQRLRARQAAGMEELPST